MFRAVAVMTGLVVTLAACEPVGGPVDPGLSPTIARVLSNAQGSIGRDIGGGMTLVSATAQGNVLDFRFRNAFTASQIDAMGREAFVNGFTREFAAGLCSDGKPQDFIDAGGQIRVTVVSDDGVVITSRRLTEC